MSHSSEVQESTNSRKRPLLVWIISIFYLLSVGWTLFSFLLIFSGAVALNEAQKTYFEAQSAFDVAVTIMIMVGNLVGTILLFLLSRYAFHLFVAAFAIGAALSIYHIVAKGWVEAVGISGLVGAFIGWGISISIILYSYHLSRKGILK